MPFKSQKQRAFMYSQHPEIAKRFEAETPPGALPQYASPQAKVTSALMKKKQPY